MAKSKGQKLDKATATDTKGAASAKKSARPRSSKTASKGSKSSAGSGGKMTKQSAQAVVDRYVGMDNPTNEPQELKDARAFLSENR
jgi:hypothetical protein